MPLYLAAVIQVTPRLNFFIGVFIVVVIIDEAAPEQALPYSAIAEWYAGVIWKQNNRCLPFSAKQGSLQ